MVSLTASGFRTLALGLLGLVLLGCQAKPADRAAFSGAPLRAAINAGCTAELVDEAGKACVQIDVFAEGEGEPVARGEWAYVHYLVEVDGDELDSSHDGKPLMIKVGESNDVIEGLHRGVEGMRVGERRKVVVPPRLGYRGKKVPGVPPEADLVFLIELMQRRDAT
ncbi:MAG: FKBP-type peptidyl-prolyl cis-trans isomerase [Enhygromyxa sp.]